jgi:hypothetical protein
MHKKVCESVKKISKYYFREVDMDLINGEPLCAEYLPLKVGVDNPRRRRREREEEEESDSMVRRRADLGFKGRVRSVLVDCTTASPVVLVVLQPNNCPVDIVGHSFLQVSSGVIRCSVT